MKKLLMSVALLCSVVLVSPSKAEKPASLAPIYELTVPTAQPDASLQGVYDLCAENACECPEGTCDCTDCKNCSCTDKAKFVRKPGINELLERVAARLELLETKQSSTLDALEALEEQQLLGVVPDTDPPPSADAVITKPPSTQILLFGATWCATCPGAYKEIESNLVPVGWKFSDAQTAHIRKVDVDKDQALTDAMKVKTLPTMILLRDGVERKRWTGNPGWKAISEQYNRVVRETQKVPQSSVTLPRYPTRNYAGLSGTPRPTLINHLSVDGHHAGKYDRVWLETLSIQELDALHTDDHNNRVDYAFVVQGIPRSAVVQAPERVECHNGRCYNIAD